MGIPSNHVRQIPPLPPRHCLPVDTITLTPSLLVLFPTAACSLLPFTLLLSGQGGTVGVHASRCLGEYQVVLAGGVRQRGWLIVGLDFIVLSDEVAFWLLV